MFHNNVNICDTSKAKSVWLGKFLSWIQSKRASTRKRLLHQICHFDTGTVFCRKQIHLKNITYRLSVDRLARKTLMSTFLVKIKILFSKYVKNIDMELKGKILVSKHQRMSKCKWCAIYLRLLPCFDRVRVVTTSTELVDHQLFLLVLHLDKHCG